MAVPSLGALFSMGVDILNSTVDAVTRTILVQTGDVVAEQVESDNVEWWQHVGFASRPSNPKAKQSAAQGICIRGSERDACVASRDPRGQSLYGQLSPGETCVYAAGPDGTSQGRMLVKGNGSISLYTAEGNVEGGASVTAQVNADGSVVFASQYFCISGGKDGIRLMFGNDAGILINKDGITQIGQGIALNSANLSLGANATNPVLWGPTGLSGVASTSVKVAP